MNRASSFQNAPRPPIVYKDLTTVSDPNTGLAIRVNTNDGSGRPRYSYEFGKLRDGKFLRYIAADVLTFEGRAEVHVLDLFEYDELLVKAKEAMTVDAQQREDKFQQGRGAAAAAPAAPARYVPPVRQDLPKNERNQGRPRNQGRRNRDDAEY